MWTLVSAAVAAPLPAALTLFAGYSAYTSHTVFTYSDSHMMCVFVCLRMFAVILAGLQGTLIATDGHLVQPDTAMGYWVAVAQRMDVILRMPSAPGVFLVSATTEFAPAMRSGIVLVSNAQPPPPGQPAAHPFAVY